MMPVVSTRQFEELLPKICDKKTASDTKNWTSENPLWGHCAVVSLVAQNLFGGELARASLEETEFAAMGSHYWNILPNGTGKDFTSHEFRGKKLILTASERTRDYILYDPKTGAPRQIMNRYKLLAWRLAKELNQDNPLFKSKIYQECYYNALNSPCQKMKFGANVVHQVGDKYYRYIEGSCNETMEPLKSLCEPSCIRFNIPSRTESMIGACSHAGENALWKAVKIGVPLNKCDLYVAGIYPNGLPYIKTQNEFTCLRCAIQIYNFGVNEVWVPTISGWQSLTAEECVKTALAYAMGEKKI